MVFYICPHVVFVKPFADRSNVPLQMVRTSLNRGFPIGKWWDSIGFQ